MFHNALHTCCQPTGHCRTRILSLDGVHPQEAQRVETSKAAPMKCVPLHGSAWFTLASVTLALLAVVVCLTDVCKGRSNFESLQLCIWRALTAINLKLWRFSLIWCACACYLIQLRANLATVCYMLWSWTML